MQSCGTLCHSENKYGDKQDKNRWGLNMYTTRKTDMVINRIGTFDGSCIELPLGKADAVMFDGRRLPIYNKEKKEWWCLTNGGRSDCFHMIKHAQ